MTHPFARGADVNAGDCGVARAPAKNPTQKLQAALDLLLPNFDDALQFDGPATAHVLGYPYVVLACKAADPGVAVAGFLTTLREHSADAQQIAWRRRPQVEHSGPGEWKVSARLAVRKGDG